MGTEREVADASGTATDLEVHRTERTAASLALLAVLVVALFLAKRHEGTSTSIGHIESHTSCPRGREQKGSFPCVGPLNCVSQCFGPYSGEGFEGPERNSIRQ